VPFEQRAALFNGLLDDLRRRPDVAHAARPELKVSRGRLLQDSIEQIFSLVKTHGPSVLRGRFYVRFVDQHGSSEMGIDAGGLSKEFIVQTNREAVDPQYGLFRQTEGG